MFNKQCFSSLRPFDINVVTTPPPKVKDVPQNGNPDASLSLSTEAPSSFRTDLFENVSLPVVGENVSSNSTEFSVDHGSVPLLDNGTFSIMGLDPLFTTDNVSALTVDNVSVPTPWNSSTSTVSTSSWAPPTSVSSTTGITRFVPVTELPLPVVVNRKRNESLIRTPVNVSTPQRQGNREKVITHFCVNVGGYNSFVGLKR